MPSTPGPSVLPPQGEKADAVRSMFGAIAPRYDLLNHLLSLNRDRAWRRRAIDRLLDRATPDGRFLDACAGTFDLSLELTGRPGFQGDVVASDFAVPMLRRGLPKLSADPVRPVCGDALRLPFADATFDGAVVGFGVRNLADLDRGLNEFARVLRPGAPLVVLEFATPEWQPFRALYLFYFRHVLPRVGRRISRHDAAYSYLPASVLEFPSPDALADRFGDAGFDRVVHETMTGGIVAIHAGRRR